MQISRSVFETQLGIMKKILKLGEFKFGKETDQFKYFKEEVMNHVYEGTKKLYSQLATDGVFERCGCGANMRHGWTNCEDCSGSGFRDRNDK